ncbi:hypothetical protein [Rhodococcus sp. IC4_135]|uniref:hypothetical protein n=1 Tax=Rhodococcus sp. IC4_135 TaxID=2715537 RepID=UPI001F0DFA18
MGSASYGEFIGLKGSIGECISDAEVSGKDRHLGAPVAGHQLSDMLCGIGYRGGSWLASRVGSGVHERLDPESMR